MLADRKEAFDRFWLTYPPERQMNKSGARLAYDLAVHSLALEHGSEDAALKFLQQRVERYAKSPQAKEYPMAPLKWIQERRWEDSDTAWGYRRTGTAPKKTTSALEDIAIYRQQVEEEKAQGKQVSLVEMFNARRKANEVKE